MERTSALRRGRPCPLLPPPFRSIASVSIDWYQRNRERSRALFDLHRSRRVLHPADRAAQSHRVLRRAPAGLQRDRAAEARARPAAASTRSSSVCSSAASIPTASTRAVPRSGAGTIVAVARRGAGVRRARRRGDRRGARRAPSSIWPAASIAPCAAARRSSPRSSTRRCTRRRCSTCGIGCRTTQKQRAASRPALRDAAARRRRRATVAHPRRRGDARRRSRARSRSAGTTSSTTHRVEVGRVRDRRAQRDQRGLPRVRRRRRLSRRASCGRTTGWAVACSRTSVTHPAFWVRDGGRVVLARHVRERPAARGVAGLREPRRKRRRSRAGRAAAADRGRVSPRRVRDAVEVREPSALSRGATRRPTRRAATSTSRRWDPVPSARVPRARAPGACTTWSATAGSGRRRLRAVPGLRRRWRRIPSTPPTSSTASTT